MAKKGFIAAPLLGTLIFLICILVIINMTRAESSAVSQAVSDAYHNKLVSTVEIYRSDLGSVFNIGLQRSIEGVLSSQCWSNFVALKTESTAEPGVEIDYHGTTVSQDREEAYGVINEKEERFFACARSASLMLDIICSKPTTSSGYIYGLSGWAEKISENTNFEGISLQVANDEAYRSLIEYQPESSGDSLCKKLIPSIEIDCEKFAQETTGGNAFQCCSEFVDGVCTVAKGCEGGNQFYLRVAVQNQEVYGKFPRILAEDTAGNKLRAGAITDVDYDAPITYPFFKYLDAAFKFNKYLAYGANQIKDADAVGSDVGARRGVVEGSCIGKDTGATGCPRLSPPYSSNGLYGNAVFSTLVDPNAEENAKKTYAFEFFSNVLKPACDEAKSAGLDVLIGANDIPCDSFIANPDPSVFNVNTDQCPDSGAYCAHIPKIENLQIKFKDNDLSAQISPTEKNSFCWYSVPQYLPPT